MPAPASQTAHHEAAKQGTAHPEPADTQAMTGALASVGVRLIGRTYTDVRGKKVELRGNRCPPTTSGAGYRKISYGPPITSST